MNHHYVVYIVQCRDGAYYAGVTNNLERRLWEHNTGVDRSCFTYKRRPVELKYYEVTSDIKQAILREKQLKGWSRKKKEALIEENWEELKKLSKSTLATLRRAQDDNFDGLRLTSIVDAVLRQDQDVLRQAQDDSLHPSIQCYIKWL